MSATKPWILGLDLSPRSHGALVFAAWLRSSGAPVIGLHALEAWASRFIVEAGQAEESARRLVAQHCAQLGVEPPTRVEVALVLRAEEGLIEAAKDAAGLVIGRAAPRGERPLVRLGQVARRLLRALPAPVIVVPPDLDEVAPGPVLLATDLGPSSDAAARFAIALAAAQGRGVELVHVGEPRHSDLIDELDPTWLRERETYRAGVTARAHAWAAELGLGERPVRVLFGSQAEEIAAAAGLCQAALVVTGSRQLGLAGRLFSTSTASALAGLAQCPVAVVPSA